MGGQAGKGCRKVAVQVLPETDTMTDVALMCRSHGHHTVRMPKTVQQARKELADGVVEYHYRCSHGCGYWRKVVRTVPGFRVHSYTTGYDDPSYHMPKGHGRLHRDDALAAQYVREFPQLASVV